MKNNRRVLTVIKIINGLHKNNIYILSLTKYKIYIIMLRNREILIIDRILKKSGGKQKK